GALAQNSPWAARSQCEDAATQLGCVPASARWRDPHPDLSPRASDYSGFLELGVLKTRHGSIRTEGLRHYRWTPSTARTTSRERGDLSRSQATGEIEGRFRFLFESSAFRGDETGRTVVA